MTRPIRDLAGHPRNFRDSDLLPLQNAIADWIARDGRASYDHIGELPHRIYDNLRGRDRSSLVHVWERGNQLTGLTIAGRFNNAFDALLAPHLRGSIAEIAMVEHAAQITAGQLAPGTPHVLTDLFETDTTRSAVLHRQGFERFRVWDEVHERTLDDVPTRALQPGFTVRHATGADAAALVEIRNRCFGQDWTSTSYLEGFMANPGYHPDSEIVVQAPGGEVAATVVAWTDPRNGLGHFEPVATHPDFHRRGLAAALLSSAMQMLHEAGMHRVTVNNDAANVAAGTLYRGLGFARVTHTLGYRRPVPTPSSGTVPT